MKEMKSRMQDQRKQKRAKVTMSKKEKAKVTFIPDQTGNAKDESMNKHEINQKHKSRAAMRSSQFAM